MSALRIEVASFFEARKKKTYLPAGSYNGKPDPKGECHKIN